jgi:DNA invertase Pin-like site-specific DNA recombinase
MATRVIGYVRVSSREQVDEGVSLGAQRAKLQAYALALDLELVGVEEDAGVSAKSLDGRHGLARALATLEAGRADGILVAKLDRLTRSVRDLGYLVDRYFAAKWSLLSVADSIDTRTASGRLVLNVLTSVAQWEREATGERTRDALAHLKSEGVLVGGVPLGVCRGTEIDVNGRRVVSEVADEQATVRRVYDLRAEGRSLRAIARALTVEGRQTKLGGRWEAATVARILRRVPSPAGRPMTSATSDRSGGRASCRV